METNSGIFDIAGLTSLLRRLLLYMVTSTDPAHISFEALGIADLIRDSFHSLVWSIVSWILLLLPLYCSLLVLLLLFPVFIPLLHLYLILPLKGVARAEKVH